MTGAEAWSLIAPMIYIPPGKPNSPEAQTMIDAYVLAHIGLMLFDSWVANGKPDSWRLENAPKKGKGNGRT